MPVDAAALVVALVALAISVWSAVNSHRSATADRTVAHVEQERRSEEEASRQLANVTVQFRRAGKGAFIIVRNSGPAAAHDVDLEIDNQTHGLIVRKEGLPAHVLLPGDEIALIAMTTGNTPSSVPAVLTWRDSAGEHREERRLTTAR